MAYGKALLILCLGLLAIQARQVANPELKGVAEEAEKLLEQLQEAVESAISSAVSKLEGFVTEIESAAEEFESDLNATLVAAIGPFLKQIEALVSEATEAGVDVADCTGDSTSEIEALPATFLANITSCVSDKMDEADEVINGFMEDIENTTNVVLDLGNQIEECEEESAIQMAICIAGVTANITSQLVSMPLQITQDVSEANSYLLSFLPTLTACDFGAKAALVLQAGTIVSNVTTCVDEKMSEANVTTTTTASYRFVH